ncbi:aspartate carbamoyltransferase [Methylomonas albis]|uniref:aspartate carbamoyltransferase n=1 Tax=Methylomonas albis TaxID=1854563 RepID=UPI001CE112A2|nr:aspartate carbamoyltransferase [Methylomonas albis]
MTKIFIVFIALFIFTAILHADEKNTNTQAKILEKSLDSLLPYTVEQTESSFTKTRHGGVQHVVAKSATDSMLIASIQTHLRKMIGQFRKGDFSTTERMHGANMPGLMQLKTAKSADIRFAYRDLENGGQIRYYSEYPQFVSALHEWFDAQARAHGNVDLPSDIQHHLAKSE